MNGFEDVFRKFFDQNELPNPFDPEGFGRYIQEIIKNAMPENMEQMSQSGQNSGASSNASQAQASTMNFSEAVKRPASGKEKSSQQAGGNGNQAGSRQSQPDLNYQAFETHDDFIIRVEILNDPVWQPKKIVLNSYQINFLNEENPKPLLQIPLPKPVEPKQIKSGFRQGILEIKLPKKPDESLVSIDLRKLYQTADQPVLNKSGSEIPIQETDESPNS